MGKRHLKRISAPKTWQIARKETTYITRPNPGPHNLETSMPLSLILKDLLGFANTTRDAKNILANKTVLVDGKRRLDIKYPAGLFDVIEFRDTQDYYRVIMNEKEKIDIVKIGKEEANMKPAKIVGKTKIKTKIQLQLYDGKNILIDKNEYNTGDSLVISLPELKIIKVLKFEKGKTIFLSGGKNIGSIGVIVDILGNNITYKNDKNETFETLKKYAFIIGEDKPIITIEKKK